MSLRHLKGYTALQLLKTTKQLLVFALIGSGLTACMVGPDFHSPAAPQTSSYTNPSEHMPSKTVAVAGAGNAGVAQCFGCGQDIPAQWWTLFHSPSLNALIQQGLANSPTLAAAQAALTQAQETLNAQIGNLFFPAVNAGLNGQRSQSSSLSLAGTPPGIFTVYGASVQASYLLDVFGGSRRTVEGYRAQVDYQRYQLIAAYLTLTSNIVTTAVTVSSLQAQILATQDLIAAESKQLDIIEKQVQLGGASTANVLTQQTLLQQTAALLPPLQKSLAQSQHSLAVLVGVLPSQSQLPIIDLDSLTLPAQLPISLPSNLVRQRPDVQAAEATLHNASAQIGVATANMLPQITLTGNYGWLASVPAPALLFQKINSVWALGAGLTQPVFHGGALWAERKAAIAGYQQASAQYEQTVLQAFQNVADSLRAVEADAREFKAQKQAEIAARETLDLTQQQLHLGGASYLNLLTAQQQYESARVNSIQAQAARYADTAALFQALGGGWWNRPPLEKS